MAWRTNALSQTTQKSWNQNSRNPTTSNPNTASIHAQNCTDYMSSNLLTKYGTIFGNYVPKHSLSTYPRILHTDRKTHNVCPPGVRGCQVLQSRHWPHLLFDLLSTYCDLLATLYSSFQLGKVPLTFSYSCFLYWVFSFQWFIFPSFNLYFLHFRQHLLNGNCYLFISQHVQFQIWLKYNKIYMA